MTKPSTKARSVGKRRPSSQFKTELAARLYEARMAKDFVIRDALADAIGVRPITLYRIEKGLTKRPEEPTVDAICKKLDIDPSWLLHGVGKGPKATESAERKLARAFDVVVEEYLSSEQGKDTRASTAKSLRSLSWPTIGIHEPRMKFIHRAREFIDVNRLLAQDEPHEEPDD